MTQHRNTPHEAPGVDEEIRNAQLAEAVEEAVPPFNLPPLPKTRRAEIRVPASINGRDLSQGQP